MALTLIGLRFIENAFDRLLSARTCIKAHGIVMHTEVLKTSVAYNIISHVSVSNDGITRKRWYR